MRRLDDIEVSELAQLPNGATLCELLQSGGITLADGRPVPELELAHMFASNMENFVAREILRQDALLDPIWYYL